MAETTELLVHTGDGLATLVLNRPHRLNALDRALIEQLVDALDRFESDDDVRVLLLTGSPRTDGRPCFCAGADLKELAAGGAAAVGERDADLVREVAGAFDGDHLGATGFRRVLHRIETFPKPVIAAIDGPCTAGGIELALACDLRLASETAQISDLHVTNLAHTGGGGATSRLSRLIGPARAKEMIFLGLVLDGHEAFRMGVVNRVVAPDELLPAARAMGVEAAKRHPVALRVAKALADAAVDLDHDKALRYDYLCWTTQMMATGGFDGAQQFTAGRDRDDR
jgi:enoyl-CoA hydratase